MPFPILYYIEANHLIFYFLCVCMINSFLINGKLLMDGYFVRLNILNACFICKWVWSSGQITYRKFINCKKVF